MAFESVERKDAWDKVTGRAKYTADFYTPGLLYARMKTSTIAHGKIKNIDLSEASKIEGVRSIITGKDVPILTGVLLEDRPVIAIDKVRYFGETVAIVVAESEDIAAKACEWIQVEYEPLSVMNTITQAIAPEAVMIHEDLGAYAKLVSDVTPEQGTNIASSYRIRKGDIEKGFLESDVIVERVFSLKKSDHVAMETRVAEVEILPTGIVEVLTASQSPFTVKKLMSQIFGVEEGNLVLRVPFVGGGFGGKSPAYMELIAYIASQAVGGKKVRAISIREEDFASEPCRLGLDARLKIGVSKDGLVKAAEMNYWLDTGAYTDIAPNMSKAIAVDCSGPYRMDNLNCDSWCVYTNHTYASSLRGFAHESYTFCLERVLDELAQKIGMDPLEFRRKNAIHVGDYSPTQVEITSSNTGNVVACIDKLKSLIHWKEGNRIEIGDHKIRAKGLSLLWKTPNPSLNASAGAIVTFNSDGTVNLNVGVVEMGSGSQTQLAQILAERLKIKYDQVHVSLSVNTELNPEYWKTVASMSTYLAGRAVMQAADDVIRQLKEIASIALRVPVEDLDIGNQTVFLKSNPKFKMGFQDLAMGLQYPDGNVVGKQIIGRGSYIMNHIANLAKDTGKGKTGHSWTVGAQAVEVEVDLDEYTYRILKAATVMDIGKVLDPKMSVGLVQGGMSMGLSLASREEFVYDENGILLDTSLRSYKVMHMGQEPHYLVEFVETPQIDAPYGTRAFSEHGIIGMPAALANAIATATSLKICELPITPETLFRLQSNDTTR